jgi:hypothetical protein
MGEAVDNDARIRIVELEYAALREEILKRMEGRQQIISITLTIAGAFLGLGWGSGGAVPILIYPSLAFLLSLTWAQSEIRISQLGAYIHQKIEPVVPGLGWEQYWRQQRLQVTLAGIPFVLLAPVGIFLITQIMAVVLGLFRFDNTLPEWVLLIVDGVMIVATINVAAWVQRNVVTD